MNKIVTLFFVVLMLQGNSGHIMSDLIHNVCTQQDHSFIATIVKQNWMQLEQTATKHCGGSIIDMKWVVSSSSCVQTLLDSYGVSESSRLLILASFNAALKTYESRSVKQFFPFQVMTSSGMRSGMSRHDIGLIELEQPFQLGPRLKPIRMATKGEAAQCKNAETVSSFPVPEKTGSRTLLTLIKMFCSGVSIVKKETCSSIWPAIFDAQMLCGQKVLQLRKKRDTRESICTEATGSALICNDPGKDALIGIEVGCQNKGARSSLVSSFLKVESYLDFIASTMRNSSISGKDDNDKKNEQKTTTTTSATTAKPASSRAGFLQEDVQKAYLLLITGTLFVHL